MLNNIKKTAITSALVLAPFAAHATLTVDGVTFNPGDQFITTSVWESVLSSSSQTLNGVGIVSQIDNAGGLGTTWLNGENGTQLTYYFSGYSVAKWYDLAGFSHLAGDDSGIGYNFATDAKSIDFTGGSVKIFSDNIANASYTKLNPSAGGGSNALDIAKATDGNLWLEYVGHTHTLIDANLGARTGTLLGDVDGVNNIHQGNKGTGYLDAIGGAVFGNFDTNSWDLLASGIADAKFEAKVSNTNSGPNWPLSGTASFKTTAIPEPGSLALIALGLLGAGSFSRRRSA